MGILNGKSHTINGTNGGKKSLPKRLGKCKHICAGKLFEYFNWFSNMYYIIWLGVPYLEILKGRLYKLYWEKLV